MAALLLFGPAISLRLCPLPTDFAEKSGGTRQTKRRRGERSKKNENIIQPLRPEIPGPPGHHVSAQELIHRLSKGDPDAIVYMNYGTVVADYPREVEEVELAPDEFLEAHLLERPGILLL